MPVTKPRSSSTPARRRDWPSSAAHSGSLRGYFPTLCSQHWFAGRIPVAAWYASQVAANAEKAGDPQLRAIGLRALMDIEAERGNAERIAEIEHELNVLSYRGPAGIVAWLLGRAMSLAWRSQFVEAQTLLTSVQDRDLTPYQQRPRYALLAVVAAAGGNKRGSTDALAAYEQAVERDVDHSTDLRPNPGARPNGSRYWRTC